MDLTIAAGFLPVTVYVLTIWVFQARRIAVPTFIHLAFLAGGLAVQVVLGSALLTLLAVAAGAFFFVAAIFIAGRYMTRTNIIMMSVAFAIAPVPAGWFAVLGGVLLAAFISIFLIAKRANTDRALFTIYESANSIGLTGGGIPTRLDESRVPAKDLSEGEEKTEEAGSSLGSLRLAPFIAVGSICAMAISAYLG